MTKTKTTTYRGERHHKARLRADQVQEIRRRLDAGEKQLAIAQEFNVSDATISRIYNRLVWRHLPELPSAGLTPDEAELMKDPVTAMVTAIDPTCPSSKEFFRVVIEGYVIDVAAVMDAGINAMVDKANALRRAAVTTVIVNGQPVLTPGNSNGLN